MCVSVPEERLQPWKDRLSEPEIARATISDARRHYHGVRRDLFDSLLGAIVDSKERILREVGVVGARWSVFGHAGDFIQTIGLVWWRDMLPDTEC